MNKSSKLFTKMACKAISSILKTHPSNSILVTIVWTVVLFPEVVHVFEKILSAFQCCLFAFILEYCCLFAFILVLGRFIVLVIVYEATTAIARKVIRAVGKVSFNILRCTRQLRVRIFRIISVDGSALYALLKVSNILSVFKGLAGLAGVLIHQENAVVFAFGVDWLNFFLVFEVLFINHFQMLLTGASLATG